MLNILLQIERGGHGGPGRWWPRSNGTRASFMRATASSVPTWRGRRSASWPSTTTAAWRSNGSKKERARSNGRGWLSCCQRRPSSAPRTGLQPRQFHADAGDAQNGRAVVADQPAREVDDAHRLTEGGAGTRMRTGGVECDRPREREEKCALTKQEHRTPTPPTGNPPLRPPPRRFAQTWLPRRRKRRTIALRTYDSGECRFK
jgi:hypothetical protein